MHERGCGKLQRDNAQGTMLDSSEGAAGNCWQDTVQGNMPKSSSGCGKLQRKMEIQLRTTRLDRHNLQVTDYGYVENEMFDLKTNVRIWRLLMVVTTAIHLGLEYDAIFDRMREPRTSEGPRRCSISLRG